MLFEKTVVFESLIDIFIIFFYYIIFLCFSLVEIEPDPLPKGMVIRNQHHSNLRNFPLIWNQAIDRDVIDYYQCPKKLKFSQLN